MVVRVFIGYDPNETVAYHVACHSIMRHSSLPVSFTPINLQNVRLFYDRKREPEQSTEFSFSRFLTPYLSNYVGQSVFMDCDVLVRADIAELFAGIDVHKDVYVVKHDYTPKTTTKFLGNEQTVYPCKNWSSVMLFNNAKCGALDRHTVESASGAYLHQFQWARNIGELDPAWNHLVTEYEPNPEAKLVHYTLGTPCLKEIEDCEFYQEWWEEYERMTYAA